MQFVKQCVSQFSIHAVNFLVTVRTTAKTLHIYCWGIILIWAIPYTSINQLLSNNASTAGNDMLLLNLGTNFTGLTWHITPMLVTLKTLLGKTLLPMNSFYFTLPIIKFVEFSWEQHPSAITTVTFTGVSRMAWKRSMLVAEHQTMSSSH